MSPNSFKMGVGTRFHELNIDPTRATVLKLQALLLDGTVGLEFMTEDAAEAEETR
jgi:hypothetical protein